MDLLNLSTEKAKKLNFVSLLHPISEAPIIDEKTKEPVQIGVISPDSEEYLALKKKLGDVRLNKAIGNGKNKVSTEALESDAMDLLVLATKEFRHVVFGHPLECTPENIRLLYTKVPWIREQVAEFQQNRANFLGE